jgi:hypothetical protein
LGDFFYGKYSSDNLSLIYSVNVLSGKMIALFYLGILTYILFIKNEKLPIGKDNPYFF